MNSAQEKKKKTAAEVPLVQSWHTENVLHCLPAGNKEQRTGNSEQRKKIKKKEK
jgi:hypothetical protein